MEEAIIAYLETYGQPQSVAAILEFAAPEDSLVSVEAALAAMASAGHIKEVNAGVHSNGEPTVEYAPLSFEG